MKSGIIFTILLAALVTMAAATRTLDADAFRSSDRSKTYNLPLITGSDDLLTVSGTQNFRNKTLISPTLSGTMQAGSATINGGTVSGSTLSNNSMSGATITSSTIGGTISTLSGGTVSGSTITGSTINTPTVSGGTFASPTLNTPTINTATVSGGRITGGVFQNGTVSGSTTLSGTMTGGTHSSYTITAPTVSDYIQFTDQGSDVAAPSAGSTRLYFKSAGLFYITSGGINNIATQEVGTFIPTLSGGTSAGTGTYTTRLGYYVKDGRRVSATIYTSITSHTGTGNIVFTGLPFSAATGVTYFTVHVGYVSLLTLTGANWQVQGGT